MWRVEADPRLRSTIMALYVLDQAPDWDRLHAAHEWASRLIPRFRQRVVDPPLHLGRADLGARPGLRPRLPPAPGAAPAAGRLPPGARRSPSRSAMTPFDRARSPWEAVAHRGPRGRARAYFLKVHHCTTDGQGGVQMLGAAAQPQREPTARQADARAPADEQATPDSRCSRGQVLRRARHAPAEAAGARWARAPDWRDGCSPGRQRDRRGARGYGRSLRRACSRRRRPSPPRCSAAAASRGASAPRGRPGRAQGGGEGGRRLAQRRLHRRAARRLPPLPRAARRRDRPVPMAMPISLRSGDHPMGGNRFAGARSPRRRGGRPRASGSPRPRLRAVTARDEPAIDGLAPYSRR